MKLPRILTAVFALLLAQCNVVMAAPGAIYIDGAGNITSAGPFQVPSGDTWSFLSGSTVNFNGAIGGTATGGSADWHALSSFSVPQGITLSDGTHTGTLTIQNAISTNGDSITLHNGTGAGITVNLQGGTMQTTSGDLGGNMITIPGGAQRPLPNVILEKMKTPQDYGAFGDGGSHPLSGTYGTLPAAQAAFPLALEGCTFTSSSSTIQCADTHVLQVGYPISGTNIPTGATVNSITDQTHFVLGVSGTPTNPSGSGSNVTLTSSYVTSTGQEFDWAATQRCVDLNACAYLPGNYNFGASTLRLINGSLVSGQSERGFGVLLQGAGQQLSTITTASGTDAIHVLGHYNTMRDLTVQASAQGGTGVGVTLGESFYKWKFVAENVQFNNYAIGFSNPNQWDLSGLKSCYFHYNATGVYTANNQDRFGLYDTHIAADVNALALSGIATTSGSPNVACTSTTGLYPGMVITGINSYITDYTRVASITDGAHFVLASNAAGPTTGGTANAITVAAQVDGTGCLTWDKGVTGAGVTLLSTNGGGLSGVNIHFEGTAGIYCVASTNSTLLLRNNLFADNNNASFLHVYAGAGAQAFVEHCQAASGDGSIRAFEDGRADIRSPDFSVDVQNNDGPYGIAGSAPWHYRAAPWHTAKQDEGPGSTYWPYASAAYEYQKINQAAWSGSSDVRTRTWECVRFLVNQCTYSSGDPHITCLSTAGLQVGAQIAGIDFPANAAISSITDATHFILTVNPTGSAGGGGRNQSAFAWTVIGPSGTITNDDAPPGVRGEIISSAVPSGSAVSLTTATPADVTSISLTPGDWDVEGNINFAGSGVTLTSSIGGLSSTSATLPSDGSEVYSGLQLNTTTATNGVTLPRKRISLSATTTIYLEGQATFSAGTEAAFGSLTARRIR